MLNNLPTPIGSTKVGQALRNDLNAEGKWNQITFAGSNAPVIKMKKLTGTTGGTEGAVTFIAHGLTQSKIIGFQVFIISPDSIPPSFTAIAEYQYDVYLEAPNVVIMLHPTNSGNLLTKAITVLITYEK